MKNLILEIYAAVIVIDFVRAMPLRKEQDFNIFNLILRAAMIIMFIKIVKWF